MNVLDSFRLTGEVALVTGGSRGLGLQIARGLGEAGAAVAITARRAPELATAAGELDEAGIRCLALPCDVTNPAEVDAAVTQVEQQLGRLDILVNNAGATWGAPFDEVPAEAWSKVLRTNVDGTFYASRAAARPMIRQGSGGRIINVASIYGLRGSDPQIMDSLPYTTSKGAVVNFTRDLAVKLAEHDITVNCICPGFFPTRMTAKTIDQHAEAILATVPLGRLGGPDDLKGLAVFLASPAAAFITGQIIAVDGGATAW
jgi:gluconate 5-dehydrogenase